MRRTKCDERTRKLVPRFRRRNLVELNVDIDDEEAQQLIDQDLKSDFIWKSDTNSFSPTQIQYDQTDEKDFQGNFSLQSDDQFNSSLDLQSHGENCSVPKFHLKSDEKGKEFCQWTNEEENDQGRNFSLIDGDEENLKQKWSYEESSHSTIEFRCDDQLSFQIDLNKDSSSLNNDERRFLSDEFFSSQSGLTLACVDDRVNCFPSDEEKCNSIDFNQVERKFLFFPKEKFERKISLEGNFRCQLTFPMERRKLIRDYSPIDLRENHFDCFSLKDFQSNFDLFEENSIKRILFRFPDENLLCQYSLIGEDSFHFSCDHQSTNEQIFSFIDENLPQIFSNFNSTEEMEMIYSLQDQSRKIHFSLEEDFQRKYSLKQFQYFILNLSPVELWTNLFSSYSIDDQQKEISYEKIFHGEQLFNQKSFSRFRCKHLSYKSEDNFVLYLNSQQGKLLQFNSNQQNEDQQEIIQNDFNDQQLTRQLDSCYRLLEEDFQLNYDLILKENSLKYLGPCLYRDDYQCDPPPFSSRSRREIGSISFDASLEYPKYFFNKSNKRYIHLPSDQCSFNVYEGYQEFIEEIHLNPSNFYRQYDSTDNRHLLNWYSAKQNLFSLTNEKLLKPPDFLCRRVVLRTILINLYCDSQPWKLFIVRVKGQFYLTLANKARKSADQMTEDEYSGIAFEHLLTSEQPNSTRLKKCFPIEKAQHQFHSVQYWNFGKYNLLYSNEIDGEIHQQQMKEEENSSQLTEKDCQPTVFTQKEEKDEMIQSIDQFLDEEKKEEILEENLQFIPQDQKEEEEKKSSGKEKKRNLKSGYVELKCTNRKVFYRDENKLQTLSWWAQMFLGNVQQLIVGYKTTNPRGFVNQIDVLSDRQLVGKFLSNYDLRLKFCFSYLYSFLNLIEKTILIDDPNTIHCFAYIPQEIREENQLNLPEFVPFRYTTMKRSDQRHRFLISEDYLQNLQLTNPFQHEKENVHIDDIQQLTKKRFSHRGRSSCPLQAKQRIRK